MALMLFSSVAALLSTSATWTRGSAIMQVRVNTTTFSYDLNGVGGGAGHGECTFSGGSLHFYCEGKRHDTLGVAPSKVTTSAGTDAALGGFDEVSAAFGASSGACSVFASIRYYKALDAFVFGVDFSARGTPGANATALLFDVFVAKGGPQNPPLSTSFPSWPQGAAASSCSFASYQGNSLGNNERRAPLSKWEGGLQGGPLALFPTPPGAPRPGLDPALPLHPPTMVLSAFSHAKAMIGSPLDATNISRGYSRVAFGVQGYVEELPASFDHRVVLVGRPGIAAATMAWGQVVRRRANTTRLNLDQDILNRKVTYWTDNGAYFCYCNRWRSNKNAKGGHYDTPMRTTIKALQKYHKSLGLSIDMYHLDSGFWHSAHEDGHCDGVTASNWSASDFHWPHVDQIGDGLGSKVWGTPGAPGAPNPEQAVSWQMLYMLLAGSKDVVAWPGVENATGNVYATTHGAQGGPWPMQDDNYGGQKIGQVRYHAAHDFWDAVIGYGYREDNLRAMVIDTMQDWFLQFHDRTNNTHRHETWMDAYLGPTSHKAGAGAEYNCDVKPGQVKPSTNAACKGGASKYRLPVRIDQALPSDHLASALQSWPAVVSARIGNDMDGGTTWTQMASSGAFLAALHIRPIMDVLWTQPVQPDNTEHLKFRAHIEHELIVAVLTAGPVGFGDSLPHAGFLGTNVSRLGLASRADGVLLKPAHTALRLDSDVRIWAAPALPSRFVTGNGGQHGNDPASDARANSLAKLGADDSSVQGVDDKWWYTLLATDVTNTSPKPHSLCNKLSESAVDSSTCPCGSAPCPPCRPRGEVRMLPCTGSGASAPASRLELGSDGSVRDGSSKFCVRVHETCDCPPGPVCCAVVSIVAADNGSGCTNFKLQAITAGTHQLMDSSSGLCLTAPAGGAAPTTVACDAGSKEQAWTATNAVSGRYIEKNTKRPLHITETWTMRDGVRLFFEFLDGVYWNTANCSLGAEGKVCSGGHFEGGSVGEDFPGCLWNASVALPVISNNGQVNAACKGCCKGTTWTKVGYAATASLQSATSGSCAVPCAAAPGPAPSPQPPVKGVMLDRRALFPTPPESLAFVARTCGQGGSKTSPAAVLCADGAPASSCLAPFAKAFPLDVHTSAPGPRAWSVTSVAPVLSGGWALVGEENKYVAVSPQRIVASAAPAAPKAKGASDALHESELQGGECKGKGGLCFRIIGAVGESVRITVLAPSTSLGAGATDLQRAMGGKIIVVSVKLKAAAAGRGGRADVACSGSSCKVS